MGGHHMNLMLNFGYAEDTITPEGVLETWSFILVASTHHTFCGLFTLPVLFFGWQGAGAGGQFGFFFGVLLDLGFDLYDFVRVTILTVCPSLCPCMTQAPWPFWFMTVIHHSLSILLLLPLLRTYYEAWQFSWLVTALLLAAGIATFTGAYKFTLNTNEPGDFKRYKAVVVLQFVVIWVTRCLMWFPVSISFLMFLNEKGDTVVFWVGCVAVGLFSIFNLAMLNDCTLAAIKWLPRPVPTTEDDIVELERSKTATSFAILNRGHSKPFGGSSAELTAQEQNL